MANTNTSSEIQVKRFHSKFFQEYVRQHRFARYTGTDQNKVITIKEDLGGKGQINVPLVTRLKGNGQTGSSTLRGNEEALSNYGMDLSPTYHRHGVAVDLEEGEKTAINLLEAGRMALKDWAMELTRDQIIQAMGAIYNGTTYSDYVNATEAAKDTYLANNSDRVLFGTALSNNSSNDHSASLANIDNTNDQLDTGIVDLLKELAEEADPKIRPIKVAEDEDFYICFVGSRGWRDLLTDSAIQQANREARERGINNPLFKGGDLMWNSTIIRKIPEITSEFTATGKPLAAAGAGGIAVEPVFFCGAQAVVWGMGKRPRLIPDDTYDYGFQPGVEIRLKHDIDKAFFNNSQHGMVTGYVAGVASA